MTDKLPGVIPLALSPSEVEMLADALRALAMVVRLDPEIRTRITALLSGPSATEWEWLQNSIGNLQTTVKAQESWFIERGVEPTARDLLGEYLLTFRRQLLAAVDEHTRGQIE